jgi:hypothetical protein
MAYRCAGARAPARACARCVGAARLRAREGGSEIRHRFRCRDGGVRVRARLRRGAAVVGRRGISAGNGAAVVADSLAEIRSCFDSTTRCRLPRRRCAAMAVCRACVGKPTQVLLVSRDFGSANRMPPYFSPPPLRRAPAPPAAPSPRSLPFPVASSPASVQCVTRWQRVLARAALSIDSHVAASSRRPQPPLASTSCGSPGGAAGAEKRDESGGSWSDSSFPIIEVYQDHR